MKKYEVGQIISIGAFGDCDWVVLEIKDNYLHIEELNSNTPNNIWIRII